VAAAIRPFPWTALEQTTRAELAALGQVRRAAAALARSDVVAAALADLAGVAIAGRVRRVEVVRAPRGIDDGVGVLLARAEAVEVGRAVLVQAERALAAGLVARALKRPTPRVVDAGAPLPPAIAGAFAAVLVAAIRTAHAGTAPRVLAAGPASALEADLVRLGSDLVAVTLAVLVGDEAFAARVVVPRAAAATPADDAWDARAVADLGPVPLAVPVVACAAIAPAAEIAALRPGDVLLPAAIGLRRAAGALAGTVVLAAPSAGVGVRAELGEAGQLVLRGGVVALGTAEAESGMDEESDKNALMASLGEVPVVVRVEVGEARMSAREWAGLRTGDVVTLGRRVGERVVLRVGGVAVADGELVDVDGEIGVRVLRRLAAEPPPP
jgi:type III secretion system YscQ/HrcQ family protein